MGKIVIWYEAMSLTSNLFPSQFLQSTRTLPLSAASHSHTSLPAHFITSMATFRPPSKSFDLDITIVSAKHIKNVNWRHGDLKPYAIFWVDSDRRLATKSDDSGSTRPVWNERFVVPLTLPLQDSHLTLEIFHSKPSETPKPLVGTLRFPLKDLVDSEDSTRLRSFEIRRPSGRPQGKINIKLSVRERLAPPLPDYHITPQPSYYYSSAPPPPVRDYRGYSPSPYTTTLPPLPVPAVSPSPSPPPPQHTYPYSAYSDPYTGYYSGYYSQPQPPPPPPPRPFFDRQSSYGGPSAPVDYTVYDQKPKGGKMGLGTGLAIGAVAGALGGLALDEGMKYEEDKISERVENDLAGRDDYSDYRANY
ncbi:hypothetical protein F0562_031701 [Nyssa sinensis]|uniref:C2 domain-containing protein n=1 Tax=Nyssa sinensis TaxID=561372 RepID=A0A5J5AW66_9ASTE|nr:hypothetical protein F0562_031701 [Nyssa sinensis]